MADVDIVDLRKIYTRDLLFRFYNELMIPNCGQFKNELDDIATWVDCFEQDFYERYSFNIVLLFAKEDTEHKEILGGATSEYYRKSNTALLSYIAVNPKCKGKGYAHILKNAIFDIIERDSKECGFETISAIFLETNSIHVKDTMDGPARHAVISSLGFRFLDFPYVQPALSEKQDKCHDLLLCCHTTFLNRHHPGLRETEGGSIESSVVMEFMKECFEVMMGSAVLTTDADYLKMLEFAHAHPQLTVIPPGTR
eukprot:m.75458 g.75458  ORF g.75458 m.75458 type:complete len:254 (-) comp50398_c0_seq3:51-812(-)